jgi:hypothetical protein
MSLDRTHELVLASFEKQRGVELPQLQSEIAHLRAVGERRNADRIRELEQRVREIQRNDDENKYLLEFGSMMFREDVKPNIPNKEKRNAVSDPRSALCNLRLESGAFARVSVWSSGADLCRAVLSKVTGVDVEGAYASIEINGQRLDRGMVLWDIGGIRVASPSARSITKSSINELRFAMRETRDTWDVRVHDGRGEDTPEIARARLADWCSEADITHIIGRAEEQDAFFLEPGWLRVSGTLGETVERLPIDVDREAVRLVRVDRIVSRKRKHRDPEVTRSGTLEGFIKRKPGEQRHGTFMEYIGMLDRLKIGGASAAAARRQQRQQPQPQQNGRRKRKRGWTDNDFVPDFVTPVKRTRRDTQQLHTFDKGARESVCVKCGSEMSYVRIEAAFVCPGYDEECVDCEGHVEVIHRHCGHSVAAVDNGPSALPFGTKLQYSHSSYKRINHFVRAHLALLWDACHSHILRTE